MSDPVLSWHGVLACPVRDCAAPLSRHERQLRCPKGHSFDVARSGYVNLLQPQDKKSLHPGDSRAAVQARRRSLERGLGDALRTELVSILAGCGRARGRVLDVGCGEGFFLRALAADRAWEVWGLDLSTFAVEAAVKSNPGGHWVVGNADRRLPLLDSTFDVVLSITSRKNGSEFRRVIRDDGLLVVAVAGGDDVQELREAMLGKAVEKDRAGAAESALAPWFELRERSAVRSRHALDAGALQDLMQGSYRGARFSERKRLEAIALLQVTSSYEVLRFRPRVLSSRRSAH